MTLVKTVLGVEIHVNEKGRFSATLKNGSKIENRAAIRDVEKFIAAFAPKGKVKLAMRPSHYYKELQEVTVTGITIPETGRASWEGPASPRLVTSVRGYKGRPDTVAFEGLVWPDEQLAERYFALAKTAEVSAAQYAKDLKAIAAQFKAVKIEDVEYALEHGGEPASAAEGDLPDDRHSAIEDDAHH